MRLDRRTLLVGGGAGIGLVVVIALWPRRLPGDLPLRPGERPFGPFLKIAPDGRVTVALPQVETGQGIWTGLSQVVADELGAAWETVAVEPAPLGDRAYANPLATELGAPAGIRITAGSTSVRAFERTLREAAATARTMLVAVAADRWNVGADECEASGGMVVCGARRASFGALAEEAAGRSPPRRPSLRSAGPRLAGQPLPRLDGPAKAQGKWRFAGDVRLPGMLFASARLAPPGGRLAGFDRERLESIPGVRHLSARDGWIAVAADSWWAAEQALKAASPRFSGLESPADPRRLFEQALDGGDPVPWFERGDYDGIVRGRRPLAATYYAAPSQHLGLEPVSATARAGGGAVELWAAAQAPGLGQGDWTLYPLPPGDPAGRAIDNPVAPIAAELARQLGRPVQVTLSQSASQNHGPAAPGALARMTALPGAGGITAAWAMRVVTADGLDWQLARAQGRNAPEGLGKSALDGAIPPYAVPNVRIDSVPLRLPYVAGYMRGSPQRELAFFTESFADELARAAGMEPLAFRMSLIGANPRLARCLQQAAGLAGWDGGSAGSTMGIAGASAFGSHIALVANATIEAQQVRVHRLVATLDVGRAVNPGLVRQQVEAGLVWALAQATMPSPEWVAGMARARPIGGIDLPRLSATPEIVVRIVPSNAAPGGVSGLGPLLLAPAVANAIHAGSGRRLRSLPFDLVSA